MIPLAAFALAACLAVGAGSDQILAGDLAAAFPEWARGPARDSARPGSRPGCAARLSRCRNCAAWPRAGTSRRRPIARSASRARWLCLTADRLLAAMHKELPAAHIEFSTTAACPPPKASWSFRSSGLRQTPAGGYWSGYVTYAGKHRFAVWARVKVQVAATRVVAAQDLKPGVPLDAAQLRLETREEIPGRGLRRSRRGSRRQGARAAPSPRERPCARSGWSPPRSCCAARPCRSRPSTAGHASNWKASPKASGAVGETIPVRIRSPNSAFRRASSPKAESS